MERGVARGGEGGGDAKQDTMSVGLTARRGKQGKRRRGGKKSHWITLLNQAGCFNPSETVRLTL